MDQYSRGGLGPAMDEAPQRDWAWLQPVIQQERAKLVKLAARLLQDGHTAEDVVQDTLISVLTLPEERCPADVPAYLRRAVYLNALKFRARSKRHAPLRGDVPDARSAPESDARGLPVIHPLELERALRGLPEAQQAVIRMKYYAKFSFREIGQRFSISANTASSRCRYALNCLRRTLTAKQGEEHGTKD